MLAPSAEASPQGRGHLRAFEKQLRENDVGESEYWTRWNRRRMGRRAVLGGGAAAALGAGAFALVGCGDDDSTSSATSAPGGATGQATAAQADVSDKMFGALQSKVGDKVVMKEDTFYKTSGQKSGGTVNLNSQYQGATVNPLRSFSGDNNIAHHIHQGLFKLNEEGGLHLEAGDKIRRSTTSPGPCTCETTSSSSRWRRSTAGP